jgi:hypothetical protein
MKKLPTLFPKWQGSGECDVRVRCPRNGRKVSTKLCERCDHMVEIGDISIKCDGTPTLK